MNKHTTQTYLLWLLNAIFSLFVICSSIWLCLALWFQAPLGTLGSNILIFLWLCFALSILGIYFSKHLISRKIDVLLYLIGFCIGLIWYSQLAPKQDRLWDAEVAKVIGYERQGDLITLHNVRDFKWKKDGSYIESWKSRQIHLNDITGINIITSYWMGPQIAHTLVSFDFKNQAPLTFSIEIRKEKHEAFSALGGFFRKYELSLVAAEETDIVYTRSNVRGEQVYFFPIHADQKMAQALFLEYLNKADQLQQQAKWYNTLTSNCTTLVFDMVQAISHRPLPMDYRLLASGYLPNYLHDLGVLPFQWDMKTWYAQAHVNPKTQHLSKTDPLSYSKAIRQTVVPDQQLPIIYKAHNP